MKLPLSRWFVGAVLALIGAFLWLGNPPAETRPSIPISSEPSATQPRFPVIPSSTSPDADELPRDPADPAAMAERLFTVGPADWAGLRGSDGPETQILMPLPNRESVLVQLRPVTMNDEESGSLTGTVAGHPASEVTLAYHGDALAGVVFIPGDGLFRIRYAGEGWHRITELDPEKIPEDCGPGGALEPDLLSHQTADHAGPVSSDDFRPTAPTPTPLVPGDPAVPIDSALPGAGAMTHGDPVPESTPLAPPQPLDGIPAGVADEPPSSAATAGDSPTTVDVLVVYTAACAAANGGTSGVLALINASLTRANQALANSQVSLTYRLAHAAQVSYTASGALGTDLGRLQSPNDGLLDDVHALREQVRADLVCLLVSGGSDYAGIAYLWSSGASASANSAWGFSVVVDAYADANLTLAHEFGHNLGCGHAAGDGGSGAFSYSYGHRFTVSGTTYRTVMAYAPGTRISHFSNPAISYLGAATGHATADNARTLSTSKSPVSTYRQTAAPSLQDWTVLDAPDLNADGHADLVWRSLTSGKVNLWLMDGTNRTSTATLWNPSAPGDTAWRPVVDGDFNGDAKPDLVWRNTSTGRVVVWYMDTSTRTGLAVIWTGDAAWIPVAAGDLNGDGKPDLVWRNSGSGRVNVWMMNGISTTAAASLWTGDPAWSPILAADFNGDSKADLVWRHALTGRVNVWFMNGATRTGTASLWEGDANWAPKAAGDFNGDGKPDLIWRYAPSGRVLAWLLDGLTRTGTGVIWSP